MMRDIIRISFCLIFFAGGLAAQVSSGKIIYERRTNLYKKFKGDDVKEWLDAEDKNKVDVFELYFTDSASVFLPQESDLKEKMSWATSKNTVYQNFPSGIKISVKNIWGENVYLRDSLTKRTWKITDSKRVISGYSCRKAIWQENDSTRIYAWYTDDIIPSVGPESFYGLPGAILGLATEDGGVIYFAKSVEVMKPDLAAVKPKTGKDKLYTPAELRIRLQKEFGKTPWGKELIKEVFSW